MTAQYLSSADLKGIAFGGLIREATGSYAPAFAASAALTIIALILVGILLVRHWADTAD